MKLKEQGPDWLKLAKNTIDSLKDLDKAELLVGKTKVFMSVNI